MLVGRCNACGAEREFPPYFKGLVLQCKECGNGTLTPKESDTPPAPRVSAAVPSNTTTLTPTPIPSEALLPEIPADSEGVDLFSKGGFSDSGDASPPLEPAALAQPIRTADFSAGSNAPSAPAGNANALSRPIKVDESRSISRPIKVDESRSLQSPSLPAESGSATTGPKRKVDLNQFSDVPPPSPARSSPVRLLGLLIMTIGLASFSLPYLGLKMDFINTIQKLQPWMGIGVSVVGVLFILLSFLKKQ